MSVERLEDRSLLAATLVGTVWQDLNSDGQQTGGEPAVQYAVAELFSSTNGTVGDSDDVSLGTRITDSAGNYQFTGLAAGVNHYVVVRPPVGFAFTVQDTGPDATDSDVGATGVSAMFAPVDLSTVDLDAGLTGAVPGFGWVVGQGGTGTDQSTSVAVDAAGNTYVSGVFSDTADFDSGPGAVNLTSAGNQDIYAAKYTAGGALVWARRVGGTSNDLGNGVAVDAGGNVLVTGSFVGTVDFDPGVGSANLTSAGSADAFVLKLSGAGAYLWAGQVGGSNTDVGNGVAVDGSGNVLVTGRFQGTTDFDPGVGVVNMTSAGSDDVFILKFDAGGAYQWAGRVGGTGTDFGYGVAVDAAGNVLITGYFAGTADFDPGAGTVNLTSAGSDDAFVLKLNGAGAYQWADRVGGTGPDEGNGVAVDGSGNVLVTGHFDGTVDFDPRAGVVNLTSAGQRDAFVLKLDGAGSYQWAGRVGGTGADFGYGVAVDAAGNVLVTGSFQDTADFEPGAGTFNRTSAGSSDGFLSRLSATNFLPPVVTGVFVRGTGDASGDGNDEWLAAYLTHLGTQGLGDAALGYRVSVGADQLDSLPWTNVDTISIRFSEGVTVVSGHLQVIGAAEGPAVPSVASFSYNSSTFTATWQFSAPLPANKYLLHFATGVVVGLDTFALDGEWTDGVSTNSGNAAAGGAFSFRMNVVPGDVNGDTVTTVSVTNADVLLTKQRLQTDTSDGAGYAYRRDVNGSGAVSTADVLLVKQQQSLGMSIFDYSEPVPPPPGEGSEEESFAAARLTEPWHTETEPWHTETSSTAGALAEPVAPEGTIDLEAWDAAILATYGQTKK